MEVWAEFLKIGGTRACVLGYGSHLVVRETMEATRERTARVGLLRRQRNGFKLNGESGFHKDESPWSM